MPKTFPTSLLRERFAKLPLELREAIASVDTANIILATGQAHHVSIDKIGKLAEEVGWIMGGLVSTKEFIPDLVEVLEVSREEATAIALEVNQKIFAPIRDHLKRMHGEKWSEDITVGAETLATKAPAIPPVAPRMPSPAPAVATPSQMPKPAVAEIKPAAPAVRPVMPEPRPATLEPGASRAPEPPTPLKVAPLTTPIQGARPTPEGEGFTRKLEPLIINPLAAIRQPDFTEDLPAGVEKPKPKIEDVVIRPLEIQPTQPAPTIRPSGVGTAMPVISPQGVKPYQPPATAATKKPLDVVPATGQPARPLPPKELMPTPFKSGVEAKAEERAETPAMLMRVPEVKPAASESGAKYALTKSKLEEELERSRRELSGETDKAPIMPATPEKPAAVAKSESMKTAEATQKAAGSLAGGVTPPETQIPTAASKPPEEKMLPSLSSGIPTPPTTLPIETPKQDVTEETPQPAAPKDDELKPKTSAPYSADPYREPIE